MARQYQSIMVAALAGMLAACTSASSGDTDGGACVGEACQARGQMCPEGEVVRGFDDDGALVCAPQSGLRQQLCSGQQVVSGIRADGSVMCIDPLAERGCAEGGVLTGVDAAGQPVCVGLAEVVREYVNTRCYVYIGWRDSCDGCTTVPVKFGRTRGADAECAVAGADSTCATFDLFGQLVQMAGVSTDGDVNDDDKFWIGLKCE